MRAIPKGPVLLLVLLACGDDGGPSMAPDDGREACQIWRDIGATVGCAATGCELPARCGAEARVMMLCIEMDTSQCLCESDDHLNCEGAFKPSEGSALCQSEFAAFESCRAANAGGAGSPGP